MSSETEKIVWQGKFITAKTRGQWEYVSRARGIGAAVILAIDEGASGEVHDRHVILVEQYRVPLGRMCLELPAGLVGDDSAGEAPEIAAARELEEETGYRADRTEVAGEFYSSPGMISESFTLVRAYGLTRVSEGGGVDGENITVHRVALSTIDAFIAAKRTAGCAIDVKLLMLLGPQFIENRP